MLNTTRRRPTVTAVVTAVAGPPGTDARRVTPCRVATVRPIGVPGVANGILGTAVHRATRCKAATVHLIEVQSVAHLADGTVIKRYGARVSALLFRERKRC